MTKKLLAARRYADLSLQFYRNKEGTPGFSITSNLQPDSRKFCTSIDQSIFAQNLVECELLSISDVAFLCDFFDLVRLRIKEKFTRPEYLK